MEHLRPRIRERFRQKVGKPNHLKLGPVGRLAGAVVLFGASGCMQETKTNHPDPSPPPQPTASREITPLPTASPVVSSSRPEFELPWPVGQTWYVTKVLMRHTKAMEYYLDLMLCLLK